jgi:hypothetical protein
LHQSPRWNALIFVIFCTFFNSNCSHSVSYSSKSVKIECLDQNLTRIMMQCLDFNSYLDNCCQNRFFLRQTKHLGIFCSLIICIAIKIFAECVLLKSNRIRKEQYFCFLFTAISLPTNDIHKGLLERLLSRTWFFHNIYFDANDMTRN